MIRRALRIQAMLIVSALAAPALLVLGVAAALYPRRKR